MRIKGSPARKLARRATALCLAYTQLLMTACASSSQPAEFVAPTAEQQLELRRGDILRINVWRQPEFSGEFEIGSSGALVHPLYQDVSVAGLTLPEARERLSEFLGIYLQGAQLVVEPLSGVTISGEVRRPARYHLAWNTTIAEAIGHAGGPTPVAHLDKVRLVRDGSEYELSLRETPASYGNIQVISGDQVFVDRQSQFNVWRDIIAPVATLAALTLTLIRISEKTGS
jgi:polysaccharide export outer membrane protein